MNQFVSAFLSFLVNGLGQIYNGQIKKGIIFIIISFVFMLLLVFSIILLFEVFISFVEGVFKKALLMKSIILFTISTFILCLNGLYSIVDAYKVAKKK